MIIVNGTAHGEVSVLDRGFAYGDGVFRTLPARNGRPLHWLRHYAKLARDCNALRLVCPAGPLLETEIRAACERHARATVKIVVTRGPGRRGYSISGAATPTRAVCADAASEVSAEDRLRGIRVRTCALRLAKQPALAGVKHLNRLENVLARAEWDDPEIAEGLLCDADRRVISGTMTNVFIATGGRLATPALDACGVAGVTRDRVRDAAARLGVECEVRALTSADLSRADEIFVVNSLTGVRPVRDLDGVEREPGPLTRRLQQVLEEEDDAQAA